MKLRLSQRILTLLILLLVMLLVACSGGGGGGGGAPAAGGTVFGVDSTGNLVSFDRNTPATLISGPTMITGFAGTILGFDFRPANGQLYMLTDNGNGTLYTVDTTTGVATLGANLVDDAAAMPVFAGLVGTSFGIDFNPVTDRLRVTSDADQNLQINVDDGTTIDQTNLAFDAMDINAAANPNVVASAHTNNFAGAASTMLFDIDSMLDILANQTSAAGTLTTVGALGFDTDANVGFDIDGSNGVALAALNATGTLSSSLQTIDLGTGVATNSGTIGDGTLLITSIAIPPPTPATVFVSDGTNLQSFSLGTPGTLSAAVAIAGVDFAGAILGMDFRPSNDMLYVLTDADQDLDTNTGTIYTVDTTTGVATLASNLAGGGFAGLVATTFGMDFDPVTDQLRVVGVAPAQNLSIDVDTGSVTVDTDLAYGAGEDPVADGFDARISAIAYSDNTAGAASTTLYGIDGNNDFLNTIMPVAGGVVQSVGALGGNVTSGITTFDISDAGLILAGLTPAMSTITTLNRIDLTTGAATPIGVIGSGMVAFIGMSVMPSN
jgi:hypothetical protein